MRKFKFLRGYTKPPRRERTMFTDFTFNNSLDIVNMLSENISREIDNQIIQTLLNNINNQITDTNNRA